MHGSVRLGMAAVTAAVLTGVVLPVVLALASMK